MRSLKRGAIAGPTPGRATPWSGSSTSPPPPNNFDVVPYVRSVEPMKDIRRQVERDSGPAAGPERTYEEAQPV